MKMEHVVRTNRLAVVVAGGALALGLCAAPAFAASSNTAASPDTKTPETAATTVALPNPMIEYETSAELMEATGFDLDLPSTVTDAAYFEIDGTGVAQAMGTLDGVDITLRMKDSSKLEDISGVYENKWDKETTYKAANGDELDLKVKEGEVAVLSRFIDDKESFCLVLSGDKITADLAGKMYDEIAAWHDENSFTIGLPNPIIDYATVEEFEKATGASYHLDQLDVEPSYSSIEGTGVAQATYAIDGVDFTIRTKATKDAEDISGVYEDKWDKETSYTASNGCKYDIKVKNGEVAVCTHATDEPGVLCVVMQGDKVSVDYAEDALDTLSVAFADEHAAK